MGRYIGTTQLREYLTPNGSLSANQNGLLDACITRAEGAIDSYTRRSFATVQGTAYYNQYVAKFGADKALYLDKDLHTLVGVVNGNEATIPLGSVWLEPRNYGPPYRVVRLKSSEVWQFSTDGEIAISGAWGFSGSAPADIVQATVRLATFYYRQKDVSTTDVAGFEPGGEQIIPQGLPQDVKILLSPYRSRTGGVI